MKLYLCHWLGKKQYKKPPPLKIGLSLQSWVVSPFTTAPVTTDTRGVKYLHLSYHRATEHTKLHIMHSLLYIYPFIIMLGTTQTASEQ